MSTNVASSGVCFCCWFGVVPGFCRCGRCWLGYAIARLPRTWPQLAGAVSCITPVVLRSLGQPLWCLLLIGNAESGRRGFGHAGTFDLQMLDPG